VRMEAVGGGLVRIAEEGKVTYLDSRKPNGSQIVWPPYKK